MILHLRREFDSGLISEIITATIHNNSQESPLGSITSQNVMEGQIKRVGNNTPLFAFQANFNKLVELNKGGELFKDNLKLENCEECQTPKENGKLNGSDSE